MSTSTRPTSSSSSTDLLSTTDKKIQRRERNREHARRLRSKQKDQMDAMKDKLVELQQEAKMLEELVEERKTASILLALSGGGSSIGFSEYEDYGSTSSSSAGTSEDGSYNDNDEFENASVVSDVMKGTIKNLITYNITPQLTRHFALFPSHPTGNIIEQLRSSVREQIQIHSYQQPSHTSSTHHHANKRMRGEDYSSSSSSGVNMSFDASLGTSSSSTKYIVHYNPHTIIDP